jgi:hypothetical protein
MEIKEGIKIPWKGETKRESETPILGELNPHMNPKIPLRIQEMANRVLESSPSGVLESWERMRVKG